MCGIAALTIAVAIVTNKLPDSQAWMAVVFFTAVGVAAWIAGRAGAKPSPAAFARASILRKTFSPKESP
jgi:hypothetical protein